MSETEEAHYLLLVEAGAEVPRWLDCLKVECLDQADSEIHLDFVERSALWLREHPTVNTVVVALSSEANPSLEDRIQTLGTRLVEALVGHPKARLLFDAPSDTSERQRRRLLGLTAALARHHDDGDGQSACIVGAHFSANPPSSSKIPIFSS